MKIILQPDTLTNLHSVFLLLSSHPELAGFTEISHYSQEQIVSWIQRFLQNFYDELILQLDLSAIEDPDNPGSFTEYRFFASYTRSIILTEFDGAVIELKIQRIRPRSSSGPSHALLPSFLCSWRRYSLPALICLIRLLFQRAGNFSKAAREAALWPCCLIQP